MLKTFVALLCTCFAMPTSAKLGETVPQLVKLFGKSYTIESDAVGKRYRFRSEKVSVDVLVSNDVSVAETYFSDHSLTASGEPPSDIVRAVLKTNVPQIRWSEIDAWTFAADYALRSSDQKHIAFLRYRGPQPEGSIWTLTVGDSKVLSSRFSTSAPSPPTSVTPPPEIPSPTQTARTADTREPSATSKSGPKPGETKEQYEQRVLAEARTKDATAQSPRWVYSEHEDAMGRGSEKFAHVDSLTTLSFGFPYQGDQVMRLVLQRNPQKGKDAYIKVDHGQFHIRYPHSNFTIRFDNGKLQTFPFDSADNGMSNVAFLGYGQYDRFIALLRKANTIDIEADFWGEGTGVVTFDVHGLQGW